jgi:hypothetical protein
LASLAAIRDLVRPVSTRYPWLRYPLAFVAFGLHLLVAEIVDQVGEERHAQHRCVDRRLRHGGDGQDSEAERDSPDSRVRPAVPACCGSRGLRDAIDRTEPNVLDVVDRLLEQRCHVVVVQLVDDLTA